MSRITANDVHHVLAKHILADGFEPVIDLEESHGSWVVDGRDGREYLDLFSMFASMPVGYNHPRILESKERIASAALNKPTNSDIYSSQLAECIDTFFDCAIPELFKYGFFIEGGALGVENALKASFDWKVKKNFLKNGQAEEVGSQVIHFEQCFHGRTGYTLSLTNTADPRKTAYFPVFDWPRIVNPRITFPLNDENLERVETLESQAVKQIKDSIHDRGNDIAAMIIEPIQGEGGDNHFRAKFLRQLRTLCDENEIMLIFDEVQSGMGLTGKMWAWQNSGVTPDMMCFGKKTQVCGFVSGDRIDEIPDNVFNESSRINSTWGGNLTDMVRLTIYLEIMREENLVERAADNGAYLLKSLEAVQGDYADLVSNSRGAGLMCAFDLPDGDTRDKVTSLVLDNGAIILGSGTRTIRFRPSLNISREEIDIGISIIKKALDALRT